MFTFSASLPRKARPSVQLDTPTGCKRQTAFDIESPQWGLEVVL